MCVLDQVCVKGLALRTNTSNSSGVIRSTVRAFHEDICQVTAEKLNSSWSLPELGANDNSVVGSS